MIRPSMVARRTAAFCPFGVLGAGKREYDFKEIRRLPGEERAPTEEDYVPNKRANVKNKKR